MELCKKILRTALLALIILVLASGTVFAAYSYYATVQVQETGGNSYSYLPIIVDIDNDYLADNGYMSLTGLDTRILSGSTELKHLVTDDKTLFVIPSVGANSTGNYRYTLGNPPLSSGSFPIIVGDGGYITVADDNNLELAASFEIEAEGYIDTTVGDFKHIVHKRDAFGITITDATDVTGIVYFEEPLEVTPGAGAWNDVDVSAYVPDYATGVVLHLVVNNTPPLQIGVRKNGSGDDRHKDMWEHGWTMIGIDANKIFECWVEHAANCDVYLVGYTGSNITFKTNADDISLGAGAAWTDIDLSTKAPGAVGVIIEVIETGTGALEWGVKKKASTDNRHTDIQIDSASWAIIGCNDSQVIEGFIEGLSVDFYLLGYITSDFILSTNADDKSIAAAGWTDIDCSVEAPGATHLIFEVIGDGDYGFRRKGSAENVYFRNRDHYWAIVECDTSQVVQGQVSIANVDFFLVGYTIDYIDAPFDETVIAAAVTPEEHTVKVTYDGAALVIIVDEGEAGEITNTTIWVGVVPDVDNDWTLDIHNVMPYMEYYKHTVGVTLEAWYQPISMVIGTNLDDRKGTDLDETGTAEEDATIMWGDNPGPVGISVTIGSLVSSSQPSVSPATEEEAPGIVPEGEVPITGGVVDTASLEDNPLYPVVHVISEYTDYTDEQIWFIGATLIILIGMGIAAVRVSNHLLLAGTVGLVLGGFFTAMSIYQWWMMLIFGFMFVMSILMERKPVL